MKQFYKMVLGFLSFSLMFFLGFVKAEGISVTFQGDNLSDYYIVAGDGFYGNVPYNLFSGTFVASDGITIESISGSISISVDGDPNAMTRLSFLSEMGCAGGLRHDNNTVTLDDQGHADIYINLSEQFFGGCTIMQGNTYWNIVLSKPMDVAIDTLVRGISLSIDSITYKDENDELTTINISKTVQGATIHFVEKDPYAPKLNFNQHNNYVANDIVIVGTGPFDALGTDGYEVPIFSNTIELLNADSISTYNLSGNTTIYIDNAPANRQINSVFYFRLTLGSCDFVTNWGETKKFDENGHAEIKVNLGKSSCLISPEYNTFKISAIARGVNSGTTITTPGFLMNSITYHKGAGYGTIEVNKNIPGTNLYFIKESGNGSNDIDTGGNALEETSGDTQGEDTLDTQEINSNDGFKYDYSKFDSNYSDEMNMAYQYAYHYGITTMNKIRNANMGGGLTRIAMAKMLSNYAISVLGNNPDAAKTCSFNDVTMSIDSQYDNGVTNACKLGIMGVGISNFRPNDSVTRAEFATALSRLLYGTKDGTDKYYSTHLSVLNNKGIISNTDPKLLEKRGYVMLMLMRAAD